MSSNLKNLTIGARIGRRLTEYPLSIALPLREVDNFCDCFARVTGARLPRATDDAVFEYCQHALLSGNISTAAQYSLSRAYVHHVGQQCSMSNGGLRLFNSYINSDGVRDYMDLGSNEKWEDKFDETESLRVSGATYPYPPSVDVGMKISYSNITDFTGRHYIGDRRVMREEEDDSVSGSSEEQEMKDSDDEDAASNEGANNATSIFVFSSQSSYNLRQRTPTPISRRRDWNGKYFIISFNCKAMVAVPGGCTWWLYLICHFFFK